MYNKTTQTPNSSYLSPMITRSSLVFIQTLLDETPTNELTNFMSHPVYTDAQTTSVVHNPEGNPKLTSYISGASEVPFGTHVDVLATKTLLQDMFPNEADHHKSSPPANITYLPIKTPQPIAQKFRDYDQKLEALINFNIFEAFEKAVQARVLTEIKKLLPTHIPKAVANYVRPRLNTSVLEVMQNNQISLFTMPSTSVDDLSYMDLKKHSMLKKLNHPFLKDLTIIMILLIIVRGRKRRKDERMLVNRLLKPQEKTKLPWFKLKKTLTLINPKTKQTFLSNNTPIHDGLPRSQGQQMLREEQHDYHVHQLKAAVVSEAQWNNDEGDVSKPRSFERHMSISSKPHPNFYNNDLYYLIYFSTEEKYTTSLTKHYAARYHIQVVRVVIKRKPGYGFLSSIVVRRSDKQEYTFSYADLPKLSLNDIEDMYQLKVQDKTHHLHLEDERDSNNALLLFIRRTVIKNRVEDLQLGVESYQRTISLTKPKLYFEGIDEKIPYTMTGT
ncbi:hypothetical protein Tco_1070136 [Tanacetum coccineum]|uniref:Uncharacterized protein n=1 Tax=Tanacetum coccineum TaxID=301880 RepID=A0ABQ5HKU4_9ASTR